VLARALRSGGPVEALMMTTLSLVALLVVVVALVLLFRAIVKAYLEFRGTRVVICPEITAPAAVDVDARHATATAIFGEPCLRLSACSRWPEREDCGQECLKQIELAPAACLARTILARFYEGRSCALCGHAFAAIEWSSHKPALMSPGRRTLTWGEVSAEHLSEALGTHLPVCWNCHIAETFRRQHPELVIDGPSAARRA
jgi:hypothetical protein